MTTEHNEHDKAIFNRIVHVMDEILCHAAPTGDDVWVARVVYETLLKADENGDPLAPRSYYIEIARSLFNQSDGD